MAIAQLCSILRNRRRRAAIMAMTAVAAAAIVGLSAFVWRGGGPNGSRFAAQMVLHSATVIFVLSLLAGPLARLVRSKTALIWGRQEQNLTVAFAASYGVFLSFVATPYLAGGDSMPVATVIFCIFSAGILLVMFAGAPGSPLVIRASASDALRKLAKSYFWLVFTFSNLDGVTGPHRPDGGYAVFAVCGLMFAFVANTIDAVVQRLKHRSVARST